MTHCTFLTLSPPPIVIPKESFFGRTPSESKAFAMLSICPRFLVLPEEGLGMGLVPNVILRNEVLRVTKDWDFWSKAPGLEEDATVPYNIGGFVLVLHILS